jgi:hypothetical protein
MITEVQWRAYEAHFKASFSHIGVLGRKECAFLAYLMACRMARPDGVLELTDHSIGADLGMSLQRVREIYKCLEFPQNYGIHDWLSENHMRITFFGEAENG